MSVRKYYMEEEAVELQHCGYDENGFLTAHNWAPLLFQRALSSWIMLVQGMTNFWPWRYDDGTVSGNLGRGMSLISLG